MKPVFLLFLLFCLTACAPGMQPRMPELTAGPGTEKNPACEAIFPSGNWQFVHAIDFSMQDGSGGTVIGVTSLSRHQIACALMTVEGLTLFEAVYREGAGIEVHRAVAPFDKPAFAEGLMADVRTIFLPPVANHIQYGRQGDNTEVCRYHGIDGRTTDILPGTGDGWQIRTYTAESVMDRSIVARSCRKMENATIPEHLELKGFKNSGYTLKMTLLHAEKPIGKPLP